MLGDNYRSKSEIYLAIRDMQLPNAAPIRCATVRQRTPRQIQKELPKVYDKMAKTLGRDALIVQIRELASRRYGRN